MGSSTAMLRSMGYLMSSAAAVTGSRLRRGPLRPGWTWTFELFAHAMKKGMAYGCSVEPQVYRDFMEASLPPSPALKKVRREAVDAGGVPSEWFVPLQGASDDVLFYVHGGAFVFGSTKTHADLIARMTMAAGTKALGINYRLSPEHPYPAAFEDALAAYRWLIKSGVSPSKVVLAGDTAGGGLVVALMVALRDAKEPLPAGAVVFAPWVDMTLSGRSVETNAPYDLIDRTQGEQWARWYVGKTDLKDPRVSPLFADLRGLPPFFIQIGSAEVLYDEARSLAEAIRKAGGKVELDVWNEMVHMFQSYGPLVPESIKATEKLGHAAREMLDAARRSEGAGGASAAG